MKIIIVFIVAALFFLALKVIRLGLRRLLNRYSRFIFLDKIIITLEFIIWLAYVFWTTNYLFRDKFFYSYLIFAFILITTGFIAWFLLKDIFAGIIFRIKYNIKNESHIKIGNNSGQMNSQHLTHLKIRTDDDQILRIPYSGIINEVITELAYKGPLEEHIIRVRLDSSSDISDSELFIRSAVMNTPWSNLNEEPLINSIASTEHGYIFEVTFPSKNVKQIKYLEKALEKVPSIHVIS